MSMMNVKRSTQAFSNAPQGPAPRENGPNNLSATDQQKAFGGQDLGDVLNKVADPNWVDPSKKMRAAGNPQLDKDAFLKLMLAQMKHQDPTNPMQSHEMAAQLAQFTSLEQLNNINSTLESMKTSQAPATNYSALAFIGKKISGDSSKLSRAAGDTEHRMNFQLMADAQRVKITVKDAAGNVVRTLETNNMKKGDNEAKWNGLTDDGVAARPGEYKIAIEAFSSSGGKVYAKTEFGGRITGVNYTAEGPVLMVNGQTIRMSDVKKIEEAGAEDFAPATMLAPQAHGNGINKTDLKSENAKQDSKAVASNETLNTSENVPPAETPEQPAGNIEDIPMSRELMAQLTKR